MAQTATAPPRRSMTSRVQSQNRDRAKARQLTTAATSARTPGGGRKTLQPPPPPLELLPSPTIAEPVRPRANAAPEPAVDAGGRSYAPSAYCLPADDLLLDPFPAEGAMSLPQHPKHSLDAPMGGSSGTRGGDGREWLRGQRPPQRQQMDSNLYGPVRLERRNLRWLPSPLQRCAVHPSWTASASRHPGGAPMRFSDLCQRLREL